jgi:hypothetical protein
MNSTEWLLLAAVACVPFATWLFYRRMRTLERQGIEQRHERFFQDYLALLDPKEREEILREISLEDSTNASAPRAPHL